MGLKQVTATINGKDTLVNVMRLGKTRRDHDGGSHANRINNRETRRAENQRKAGKRK